MFFSFRRCILLLLISLRDFYRYKRNDVLITSSQQIKFLACTYYYGTGVLTKITIGRTMKRFNRLHLSILYGTALSLAGCGGSSSTDPASLVTDPILTGYFTDSAVEGLNYTTITQSGVTDVNGAFSYQAGESVVFSIGDFVLGESATAAPEMTPLDLIPDATLPTTLNELSHLLDSGNSNTSESIAFRTLSNMLTFLQALDSDKDASNGITVADGMASILQSKSIDLTMDMFDFREIHPLKQIMGEAVEQGLISSGFIKQVGQALNHFYQVQEISNSFQSVATDSYDSNADSSPDRIKTYTYDANGNQLTESTDSNADSSPDSIRTYTYDANGNRLTYSTDTNGDSSPNEITTYTYDANGNRLTYSDDSNGDSSPDRISTYTYDANGNQLTNSNDTNGDSSPNSITTYTYDANGNQLTMSDDSNGDSSPNLIRTYTYDANGNRLTYSDDTNGDSSPNSITTLTFDANGNPLTESTDSNGDSSPNSIRTYTYDANGNTLTESTDSNGDSSPNSIRTFTYDANGNRLTFSTDTNGDSSPNEIRTYTYDANGNQLTNSYDSNGDSSPNSIRTYTYDANGNQLTNSNDTNGDRSPNSIRTYTYDANGNQLTNSNDTNGDSSPNSITTYTYVDTNIGSDMGKKRSGPE
jgi:hypothetical protein